MSWFDSIASNLAAKHGEIILWMPASLPLTVNSFGTRILPMLATYYATAILRLLSNKTWLPLSLLPLMLYFAARATSIDISGGDEAGAHGNQAYVIMILALVMRVVDWCCSGRPYRRLAKVQSYQPHDRSILSRSVWWDALDLATNYRYIGWNYGQDVYVPQETRSTDSRWLFVSSTIASIIGHAVLCDILQYTVQSFLPNGGTFDSTPSLPLRFAKSWLIALLSGWAVYPIARVPYDIFTVIGVVILQMDPKQWPLTFDAPWKSTSLIDLWGKRWHQTYKRLFIQLGVKPFSYLGGRAIGILSAFLISGIMHDIGLRAVGRGSDFWAVCGFFVMMGIGVNLEVMWFRITGKRVGGYAGWLWTFTWVTCWGTMLAGAWLSRGGADITLLPESYRPAKAIVRLVRGL